MGNYKIFDDEFTNELDRVDDVVISKGEIKQIEKLFKKMSNCYSSIKATVKVLEMMHDCRVHEQEKGWAKEFGHNGFIQGGLEDAIETLAGNSMEKMYEVITIIDDCIKREAAKEPAV